MTESDVEALIPSANQGLLQRDYKTEPPPSAKYNKLSETLRNATSGELQCSIFCGGRKCKYELSDYWPSDQMAINGIYSHWITEDIVAMARPNTKVIESFNILEQFERYKIKSVINLQRPGEHNNCGPPLTTAGFTYDPQIFMENEIFYYNFTWKDYGVASVQNLLDMVKVMAFTLTQGKVCVHCHAGLGRTGVLAACYLIYSLRCKPNDAIRYVRLKRPNAIQTRGQIKCIQKFGKFLAPLFAVFSNIDSFIKDFSVHDYLKRQKHILHGYEARHLKYIPKIVYMVGERLLELANCKQKIDDEERFASNISYELEGDAFCNYFLSAENDEIASLYRPPSQVSSTDSEYDISTPKLLSPIPKPTSRTDSADSGESGMDSPDDSVDSLLVDDATDITDNTCFQELSANMDKKRESFSPVSPMAIAKALLEDHCLLGEEFRNTVRTYQKDLNTRSSVWTQLSCETDLNVLGAVLWSWLEHLGEPVLATRDLSIIVLNSRRPIETLAKLDRGTRYTTEYVLRFVARLQPLPCDVKESLLRRATASLTKQGIPINGVLKPAGVPWNKMREGTLKKVIEFISGVFKAVSNETIFDSDSEDD